MPLRLTHAQRWLSLDRLNEAAYRAAMRQMAGLGDRSGAIRLYQTCMQNLKSELGVAPQPETEELYQFILHGELSIKRPEPVAAHPIDSTPQAMGNLPIPATPFIGRLEEIEQISKLVLEPATHLLTLTGPGGNGKTRLSIQAAGELAKSFHDGAWFVALAPVQSDQGLIPAIANALGLAFYKGETAPIQQLLDYLRQKQLLLILDNFEHLLEAGRELVVEILEAASQVKIIVTSRERLNLQAERVYRVPGMSIPDELTQATWNDPQEQARSFSGIQLLVERARQVQPDFQLTRRNLEAVVRICQLVDGSPLGIELAVGWLELLPPEEIAGEIAHSLDFLESPAADAPARQRSLRAVFETSWKWLEPEEQQAFKRLCAFRGSFSRQAAQAVSGASLKTLLSLVNKSWLQQGDNGRYQLHEVLKQYGMERLETDQDEWQETRDRQAEFFANFMQVQGQGLRSAEQLQALQMIKLELESNIPQAWAWLVLSCDIDTLIEKMLPGLFHYLLIRGNPDVILPLLKQARKAVAAPMSGSCSLQQAILETVETNLEMNFSIFDDQPRERLQQLWARVQECNLQEEMGFWYIVLIATYGGSLNYAEGTQKIVEALPIIQQFKDPWILGYGYLLASRSQWSNPEVCKQYLSTALENFKKIGVLQEQGITLQVLGNLAASEYKYELAIEYNRNAQYLFAQVGDELGVDSTWSNLGEYYVYSGKIDQAFHAFAEQRRFSEKTGNRRMLGTDLSWESLQASRYRELDYALELRRRSLEIAIEVGNQNDIAWHTWELGEIHRLMGNLKQARKYFQEAYPVFEKIQEFNGLGFYHRGMGDIAMMEGDLEGARDEYGQALEYHQQEQRGNRPWGLALTHARLGNVLVKMGAFDQARQHLNSSLSFAIQWHNPDIKSLPLAGIAGLLLATGLAGEAIEVAACVLSKPTTWNEVKKQAGEIIEAGRTGLSEEEAQLCQQRGEKLELDELCERYAGSEKLLTTKE